MFVSYLAKQGLAPSSIKVYLSAVRSLHVHAGLHNELAEQLTPRLQMVLKGIKRERARSANPDSARLPITVEIMEKIKQVLARDPTKYNNIMLWAACCLAFFGFLRCSEFTIPNQTGYDQGAHLSVGDVATDSRFSPTMIIVNIKQSKTDPFRQGIKLHLGKTGQKVCPVEAVLPYLAVRRGNPGPLFVLEDSSFLTRKKFTDLLGSTLQQAGINDKRYTTHSFRIGAATTAKAAGIDDSHIKMLGRWKSDAYQTYIRTPQEELAKLSKRLVSAPGPSHQ